MITKFGKIGTEMHATAMIAEDIAGTLSHAGYMPIDVPILLAADEMLDLYGEDIRSRAFVFDDTDNGTLCLRPDFTLPVCRLHLDQENTSEARYAYIGPVFRRHKVGSPQPIQILQTGVELFGALDIAEADVEVFSLLHSALGFSDITPDIITGDLGIIYGVLDAAPMPHRWRTKLRRHIRRPARFHSLIAQYARGSKSDNDERDAFLKVLGGLNPEQARKAISEMMRQTGATFIGQRNLASVQNRLLEQAEDAISDPISNEIVQMIESVLDVKGSTVSAFTQLSELASSTNIDLSAQLSNFERRLEKLAAKGYEVDQLQFDASYGRDMEYYDGFVFEFTGQKDGENLRLGGGGRYDQLTEAAGATSKISAVGGVLRPEVIQIVKNKGDVK